METARSNTFANTAYGQSLKRINSANPLKREDILRNYSNETVQNCWDTFCKYIVKNYQSGRGTIVPKFGTFTFTNTDVNLEGTTNQFNRDLKARKPVFIVSSDYIDKLKPGISTSQGIIYYTQKLNNNISLAKINMAEIAYSLSMKKEECFIIIDNMIKLIGDNITKVK